MDLLVGFGSKTIGPKPRPMTFKPKPRPRPRPKPNGSQNTGPRPIKMCRLWTGLGWILDPLTSPLINLPYPLIYIL